MRLIRILSSDDPLLAQVPGLYEESFPDMARIDSKRFLRLIDECPEMTFNVILDNEQFCGMAVLWELEVFRYFEYFATMPSCRNKGLGASVLKKVLAESNLPVVGEVEPPETEIQKRRLRYYERNGIHIEMKNPTILNDYHNDNLLYLVSTQPLDNPDECQRIIIEKVYNKMYNID